MFSQCPKCETAFRITPEQLQQAGGRVRCGKCQHIYNALNPVDEPETVAAPETGSEWLNDPEEQRALEIEAELDEIERTGQQRILNTEPLAEADTAEQTEPAESTEATWTDVAADTDLPEIEISDAPAMAADSEPDHEISTEAEADLGSTTLTADDIAEILAGSDDDLLSSAVSNDDFFDDDDEIDSGTIVMIDDDDDEAQELVNIADQDDPIDIDSLNDDVEIEAIGEDDTFVPDEPIAKNNGDELEFNVPKQQWGKFFAGRYEGPIIESVGPLEEEPDDLEVIDYDIDQNDDLIEDDAGTDLTDSIAPGAIEFDADSAIDDDDVIYISDDDEALDDLEDLLEEESEALQTYSDLSRELTDDDIDETGGTDEDIAAEDLLADEADTITAESELPSESADKENTNTSALRSAIDTLSMEKAEWQRLLEAADNEPDTLFVVEDDTPANERDAETDIAITADSNSEDDDNETADTDEDVVLTTEAADKFDDTVTAPLHRPTAADLAATPLWLKDAEEEPPASGKRRWLAIGGVLVATLMLGSQLIHHNREALATDPNYGETVRKVYQLLDRPLYPAWELSAYKIRSSEAIYGESTEDFLDIRAQLAVTGDKPMGEPEIKVILKDRWGNPVNSWMFTPEQYMQGMRPPNGLIQPGTLIPITLSVLDPGSAAQGFELAVCVRREGGVLQCSGQQ